jgi:RimJ/RimL family protein N-acetyltransferase
MAEHWINHPTILKGEAVDLLPLEREHFDRLFVAAADKKLWELIPVDCSKAETFESAHLFALAEREKGSQYPFVIYHKATDAIIGSTRLFEIFPKDLKLEIGWTWIIEKYWGTEVNFECKLLLLTFCFEVLKTRRVQIKTDQHNLRSRKAIEKIGGQFEGILRKDRIKENGDSRSAAYYSIIDDEWETAKQKIINQLAEKKMGSAVVDSAKTV